MVGIYSLTGVMLLNLPLKIDMAPLVSKTDKAIEYLVKVTTATTSQTFKVIIE